MKYTGEACSVEHIQSSQSETGKTIHTLVLEYPRAIHAQLLTHRVFSKNSSSSRAVPVQKMMELIKQNPSTVLWTYDQPGMQGKRITDVKELSKVNFMHKALADAVCNVLNMTLQHVKVHKQNLNRYLEPFQNIRVVLTSTEWENWDWLRIDPDAQPEITELANLVKQARDEAKPAILKEGQWHVPFVERMVANHDGDILYHVRKDAKTRQFISLEEAKAISASCCAQVSYRRLDNSFEKAMNIYDKLIKGNKVHASPFEHQATPIPSFEDYGTYPSTEWPKGVTAMSRDMEYWSGNFQGFIQHRQLLQNHDGAKLTTAED